MQAHYSSILDLSETALMASEKGYLRLMEAMEALEWLTPDTQQTSDFDVQSWRQKCYDAMNDDFNTPVLIAQLFEAVKYINLIRERKSGISNSDSVLLKESMDAFVFEVLGLEPKAAGSSDTEKLPGVVELLIELRNEARTNKDFTTSDKIRDQLTRLGIQLKDGKEGTTFSISG
jgi:cysteinyl-tRNA synthetase